MGLGPEGARDGSCSSRLGGRTIRATSVILALRRKMEPKGIMGRGTGVGGGMIFGAVAGGAAGFGMKGELFSSGFGAPVEMGDKAGAGGAGTGLAFLASRGR